MSERVVGIRVYLGVFASLMVLTWVTVQVARLDLGWMNTLVALAIAGLKAMLVVLYFMHVRYSPRLIWIFAASGFLWLGLLIGFTLMDAFSREWLGTPSWM